MELMPKVSTVMMTTRMSKPRANWKSHLWNTTMTTDWNLALLATGEEVDIDAD